MITDQNTIKHGYASMSHAEKMAHKRARTSRPGFTPVLPTSMRGVRRMVKRIGREAAIKALT